MGMAMRAAWAGVLGTSVLIGGGCLAVAAGAVAGIGAYSYAKGELETTAERPIARAWSATRAAVDQLGLAVVEESHDEMKGRLVARQADGTRVTINLTRKAENVTAIRVRVGVIGDEEQSRLILRRIEQNL